MGSTIPPPILPSFAFLREDWETPFNRSPNSGDQGRLNGVSQKCRKVPEQVLGV